MTVTRGYSSAKSALGDLGFTLLELMIALAIGIVVLGGLVSFFMNASRSHAELKKTAEHTSNGSMGMSIMTEDINHAGYFGEFYNLPFYAVAMTDPCLLTAAGIYDGLEFPIQGYDAPAVSPLTCLSDANFVPGTDILVVRHAEFLPLAPTDIPTTGEIYVQAINMTAEVQIGVAGAAIG